MNFFRKIKNRIFKKSEKNTIAPQIHTKLIGSGAYGYVIEPAIDDLKKVCKIIDITCVTKSQFKLYKSEIHLCKKLKLLDPHNETFLIPDTFEMYDETDETIKKRISIDKTFENILKHMHNFYPTFEFLSFTMERGEQFGKILSLAVDYNQIISILHYLLISIKKIVYEYQMCLMDIRPENILFLKNKYGDYYPVFIDFTRQFVIDDKNTFGNFFYYVNNFIIENNEYWPNDLLFYKLFYLGRSHKKNQYQELFRHLSHNYKDIDILEEIKKYKVLYTNAQYFHETIMIYSLGKVFLNMIKNKKLMHNKFLKNIFKKMVEPKFYDRFRLDYLMDVVENELYGWDIFPL
jgi:hypothetical protein